VCVRESVSVSVCARVCVRVSDHQRLAVAPVSVLEEREQERVGE
jgi:hypothetical protein